MNEMYKPADKQWSPIPNFWNDYKIYQVIVKLKKHSGLIVISLKKMYLAIFYPEAQKHGEQQFLKYSSHNT